jgi:Concanavalin A-like lectin/glucanases superfamily
MPPSYPTGSYPALVVADGATAYWRLGETSGTTAVDVIGGANGTISGGVTLGQAGALADGDKAMAFNGTTGKIVTVANVPLLTPYTLEVWIQTTSPAAQKVIFSTLQEPTPEDALMVQVNAHQLRIYIEHSGGAASDLNPTEFFEMADGIWHHLVIAFLGTTVAVYFDGVQKTWTNQPTPALVGSGSHFVELGSDSKYGLFYGGSLDDVAIYPIALSPAQVSAHYAARTFVPFVLDKALTYARSGIARSGATRSNYVSVLTSIDWIVRDTAGNILETRDLSSMILLHSLTITQALHNEPDTCSFSLSPNVAPGSWPAVGAEIRVSWAPGGGAGTVLFHGFALIVQQDWRMGNQQGPWGNVQCQDAMWRFDARIVTYRFPNQSVTASIEYLVKYFCNLSPTTSNAYDFLTGFVQQNMPTIPAFEVINQRPSTVLRTLTNAVGGGFYLEGFALHAWANSVTEPNQANPQPLTVELSTLKAFRLTTDATQLRRRVTVEGRRTSSLISWPDSTGDLHNYLGLPLQDATIFGTAGGWQRTRTGSQWVYLSGPVTPTAAGKNPTQTKTTLDFTPGDSVLQVGPVLTLPPARGWIRVGNQYSKYGAYTGDPLTGTWVLQLPYGSPYPYGMFTTAIKAGETVEWVDCVMAIDPPGIDPLRAQPVNSPVVIFAIAETELEGWPPLEGFVQDGRYSYEGAQARADADLAAFQDPLSNLEWETEDNNAIPGREQVVAMSSEAITVSDTVTILRVDLSFPLRTLPARRRCTGGTLKPSSFLDLVVTSTD